jgi:hypothetical protein
MKLIILSKFVTTSGTCSSSFWEEEEGKEVKLPDGGREDCFKRNNKKKEG